MREYQGILDYIEGYWDACIAPPSLKSARNLVMRLGRVRLPYPSVAPNDEYFAGTQFYWDTYFAIIGLVDAGRTQLAKGMVDNLLSMFPKFGLVPARNSLTSLGRTQPPYLTRMAFEVYEAGGADKAWLGRVMTIARREYENVWLGGKRYDKATGLSRYHPRFFARLLTVYESGWDVSTRFSHGGQQLLPIDLNCQLYQYEADLLKWSMINSDKQSVTYWKRAMKARKAAIDRHCWDESTGFYYDNVDGRVGNLKTLAGFYPLWCGLADKAQAKRLVKQLNVFEHDGGLSNTEKLPFSHRQWDYPNGWAPLQYIIITGLRRYGFDEDAARLSEKWLECNRVVYKRTGQLWEKYDVVRVGPGRHGRYPTQPGFAWTNAVFLRLLKHLRQPAK